MEYFLSVVIGIVSSLIATATFVGLVELTRRVILPWYADNVYRGVRIDGHWEDTRDAEHADAPVYNLDLKQKGDRVTGIYSHGSKESNVNTCYHFTGTLRDTYFTGTAHPVSNDMIDAVTFLLRVYHGQGTLRMKGCSTYVSTDDGTVESSAFDFGKKDSYS